MSDQRRIKRWLLSLFVVCVAAAAGLAFWLDRPPPQPGSESSPQMVQEFPIPPYTHSHFLNTRPEVAFVGSRVCAGCHPKNQQSYQLTAHSRALSDVDPSKEPPDGSFDHALSGRSYRVYRKDGKLHHQEVLRTAQGEEIARVDLPVRYIIGSGHFCRTYIVEVDGFLHESPITWYTSRQKWDLSPGYDFPQHWGFERPIRIGCVACHSGGANEVDGAVNRLSFHEQAIGCESCHGPGSLHEARHGAGNFATGEDDLTIVHPAKLSRPLQEAICAACHQNGPATVAVRGRTLSDFRPGRPLSDYRIHYEFANGNQRMSVVGHVEQLRRSACYQKSETLTCVSCHDPHRREELKDKTAFYREKCMSCHRSQPCKMELGERMKKQADNCVACHMPQGDTDIPHIAFTHHRIGLHGANPAAKTRGVPELAAVDEISHLDPLDRRRNLALAYVEAFRNPVYAESAGALRSRALEHLEAVYAAGLREPETTFALAEIYRSMNDTPRSRAYLRETLEWQHAPSSVRAGALLLIADYERQDRDFPAAISHLEEAVRRQRYADNWRLLGASYLDEDRLEKALQAFGEALAIRPYRNTTHLGLAETYRRLGDVPRFNLHLEKARWLREHHQD